MTARKRQGVPFNQVALVGREFDFLREAIDNQHLSGDGAFTRRCNAAIAAKLGGGGRALLTHSCTAALEMAAILADLCPGDEVILPSFTFVSTANAVVLRGATAVFVDIDPRTLNIDPAAVAAAVTPRTRAIIAVHYAGVVADMTALGEIAKTHGLLLIEDAAQAYGSTYHGQQAGSIGDLSAFSFHETKNVISGEGGAIVVNRADLYERAEIIREKGTDRSRFFRGQVDKYSWVDVGSSFLPSELIAAFLLAQLEQEDRIRRTRLAIWDRYDRAFRDLAATGRVGTPHIPQHCTGNGHLYYLMARDLDDRTAYIERMKSVGIQAPFHYVPLHSAPAGRKYGRVAGSMAVTDSITERLVRLPFYLELGADIDKVIEHTLDHFGQS